MKPGCVSVAFLLFTAKTLASAIPNAADGEHKTSHDRMMEKDLNEETHFEDENHNAEYDHKAFLGNDDAVTFDQLDPEESQRRLGMIYDKIDNNKDQSVTEEELVNWIKHVQNKYIITDTERQWKEHDSDKDDTMRWESYKERTYGSVDENDEDDDGYHYKDMIQRDERRWKMADGDKDGTLTKEEFSHFLHPEEVEHMRDIVIDETLEDIDKNGDGVIDLQEYIADMWPENDEEEPDWVKTEREQFHNFRDKNSDGQMDREEVKDWIIPPDYDHSEAEAKHLIFESDSDRDGVLTKEEVLNKYDLFVGSQATDFGEALTQHDEF